MLAKVIEIFRDQLLDYQKGLGKEDSRYSYINRILDGLRPDISPEKLKEKIAVIERTDIKKSRWSIDEIMPIENLLKKENSKGENHPLLTESYDHSNVYNVRDLQKESIPYGMITHRLTDILVNGHDYLLKSLREIKTNTFQFTPQQINQHPELQKDLSKEGNGLVDFGRGISISGKTIDENTTYEEKVRKIKNFSGNNENITNIISNVKQTVYPNLTEAFQNSFITPDNESFWVARTSDSNLKWNKDINGNIYGDIHLDVNVVNVVDKKGNADSYYMDAQTKKLIKFDKDDPSIIFNGPPTFPICHLKAKLEIINDKPVLTSYSGDIYCQQIIPQQKLHYSQTMASDSQAFEEFKTAIAQGTIKSDLITGEHSDNFISDYLPESLKNELENTLEFNKEAVSLVHIESNVHRKKTEAATDEGTVNLNCYSLRDKSGNLYVLEPDTRKLIKADHRAKDNLEEKDFHGMVPICQLEATIELHETPELKSIELVINTTEVASNVELITNEIALEEEIFLDVNKPS